MIFSQFDVAHTLNHVVLVFVGLCTLIQRYCFIIFIHDKTIVFRHAFNLTTSVSSFVDWIYPTHTYLIMLLFLKTMWDNDWLLNILTVNLTNIRIRDVLSFSSVNHNIIFIFRRYTCVCVWGSRMSTPLSAIFFRMIPHHTPSMATNTTSDYKNIF